MTNIKQKAVELVNEVRAEYGYTTQITYDWFNDDSYEHIAFLNAIEQHEAFRKEVSDAVVDAIAIIRNDEAEVAAQELARFIITKPDPLVEAMVECGFGDSSNAADDIRAALAKRGLEIREKE